MQIQNVKQQDGKAALHAAQGGRASCGEATASADDPITSHLYDEEQITGIPLEALAASLGCGNPTALAQLNPGETVLDLGSGGGIDVLLSARRVGPTGKTYGLDMTDEMEDIPLLDNSVDIIVSNCVINLSAAKDRVLSEALRVLRPGGRFAISDIIVRGEIPEQIQRNIELWIGCIAGVLEEQEYQTKLAQAGFTDIKLELTRIYRIEDAHAYLSDKGINLEAIAAEVDGKFGSAFVRARKPTKS